MREAIEIKHAIFFCGSQCLQLGDLYSHLVAEQDDTACKST